MSTDTPQDDAFDVSWSKPESGSVQPTSAPQINGYRIETPLGKGGMGTVWRAMQLSTGRYVALKVLKSGVRDPEKAQRRFEREVQLTAQLRDKRIVQVYQSGLFEGVHFYAMELVEGEHLDQFVAKQHLEERQILELIGTVADIVEHAHLKGVIHRDLKPSNILVTKEGEPRVLDFGLAKMVSSGDDTEVSVAGEVLGTPAYMSPEQAAGKADDVDRRSDVYSLGVILFRLLTGQYPHGSATNKAELLRRIAEEEVQRPRKVNPRIQGDLEKILLKTLARVPGERYATAGGLADDIRNYLAGRPITVGDWTATYFLKLYLRRHRTPVMITLLVFGTLIGTVLTAYVRVRHERDRALVAEGSASRQTVIAEHARQQADTRAEQLQRALYFSRITLAHDAYGKGNLGHMCELLALCPVKLRNWEWRYLDALAHRSEREIATEQEGVCAVVFSPTGDLIATAASDGTIKLWNATGGTLVALMPTEKYSLTYSVAFSPDGKRLVSGHSQDVVLWDVSSGEKVRTLDSPNPDIRRVRFSPDGKSVAFVARFGQSPQMPGSLHLWGATTGDELLGPDEFEALDFAFSPDGKRIAASRRDRIVVLDLATREQVLTFKKQPRVLITWITARMGNALPRHRVEQLTCGTLRRGRRCSVCLGMTARSQPCRFLLMELDWLRGAQTGLCVSGTLRRDWYRQDFPRTLAP